MDRLTLATAQVDLQRREVRRGDAVASLTELECRVLRYMAAQPGVVIPREELEREVWGFPVDLVSEAVPVAMRRLRKKLEPNPRRPESLLTARSVGWSLHLQPERGEGGLIGREAELRALRRALSGGERLVTLHGLGGIGKTALARRACAEAGESVSCALGSGERDALAEQVSLALGMQRVMPLDQLGVALRARGALLLHIDHLEWLEAEGVAALSGWLERAPELRVLGTSRRPIARGVSIAVGPLDEASARTLLAARVEGGRHAVTPATVDRLARTVGGIPLAIELVAARLSALGPARLLDGLKHQLPLLRRQGARPGMREVVAWAWRQLSEDQEDALLAAASFAGTCSVPELEVVVARPQAGAPVWDRVEALVALGLLHRAGRARFRCARVVREFAEEQGMAGYRRRHLACFVGRAAAWSDLGAPWSTAREGLQEAAEDLRQALQLALSSGEADDAARLALALDRLFDARGPAEARLGPLRAARAAGPSPRLRVLLGIQESRAQALLDVSAAEACAQRERAAAEALGEADLAARAAVAVAKALFGLARPEDARVTLEAALAEGALRPEDEAEAWGLLAVTHRARGDLDTAERTLLRQRVLLEGIGDALGLAVCRGLLATVHLLRGDRARCVAEMSRSAQVFGELGHSRHQASALFIVAMEQRNLGLQAAARETAARLAEVARRTGALTSEAEAYLLQHELARLDGDHERARELGALNLDVALAINEPLRVAMARYSLGVLGWSAGEPGLGRAALERALALALDIDDEVLALRCALVLECVAHEQEGAGAALPPRPVVSAASVETLAALGAVAEAWRRARAGEGEVDLDALRAKAEAEGLLAPSVVGVRRLAAWLGARSCRLEP